MSYLLSFIMAIVVGHRLDMVHPAVWVNLRAQPQASVWVFFSDRGFSSEQARHDALGAARTELPARTAKRRALRRTQPGLVDLHDLPVNEAYIRKAMATGAELRVRSKWLNAISVSASKAQVVALAALPFVERIEPVRRGRRAEAVPIVSPRPIVGERSAAGSGFYGAAENQLQMLGIIDMHTAGYTGEGMVIGVLDTGFKRTHVAYNEPGHEIEVIAEYDFINDDDNTSFEEGDPDGQHNHGTLVLSTIGGYKPNELVGGAYDASFVLAKTEDTTDEYMMEEDYYVAGLEFIENNGADVATSSLGYYAWYDYEDMDGLTAVTTIGVNIATANGLACCTAVGNGGFDQDLPSLIAPSDAFDVFACGAVTAGGTIADFSSDGPSFDGRVKPEVLAQGVETACVHPNDDNEYITANGTSLSTPLVASAVTLLLQAHPDWTISDLRSALFETASYYVANGVPDPENRRGYGIIDVFAASQVVFCSADLDGNGAVDISDLLTLLAAWGPCEDCPADIDGSGEVDILDLLTLLADWGPCA